MNIMNLYVYENRSVSNDLSKPILLENINVDTVKVHIPKEIDGTDMGTWAWWFVYQNAKREKYSVPMTLEGVTNDEGEEEYISTVGLNHGFTGKHGTVMYAIEAVQADGSGAVTHEWHTRTYKLEIVHTLQGNQTEYSETESDIISALISRVNELITSGAEIAEIAATIERAAETAQEVIDSIPSDYSSLSNQVDTNTAAIALKADQATTYTKTEVDALIEENVENLDTGLTESIKSALMNLAEHIGAWTDGNSQEHIDALHDALYPPADVVNINAIYTQTTNVYTTSRLEDLKSDLIVTATYSDNTTSVIGTYALSGTLEVGTSTITVEYANLTTTFTVTVSESELYTYSYANGDLIKFAAACAYLEGVGVYYTDASTDNKRRTFFSSSGENALLFKDSQNNYVEGEYYPIPIPNDATGVTISITPATNNIGPAFHTYDEATGVYTRVYNPGWIQGSNTYTFTAGEYDALTVTSKTRFGTAFSEDEEPTELTIVFE